MNTQDLRSVFLDLLADLRTAGRGASRRAIGELLDRRLPAMMSACDRHAEERVAQTSREQILRAVVTTTRARIELGGRPAPSTNGAAHGFGWPWQRVTRPRSASRWSWGLGLAGAAALLLVGWMLYSALNKPIVVKQDERSGTSVPIPKEPEKRPDGEVVKGGTPPEKEPVPKPGTKKQESLVAVKQPEVGKLSAVMGEPLVYPAGSKKSIAAEEDMAVAMGSTIETGDMDKLELKFTDGTTLRLDFNTRVLIGTDRSDSSARSAGADRTAIRRPQSVSLQSGRLYAMVTHRVDGDHFKVETPAATAEVIGTEFGLKVEKLAKKQAGPDYRATLQVKRGKVRFYNGLGEQTATDSTESWATEDSMPTEPKRLSTIRSLSMSGSHVVRVSTSRLTYKESFESLAGQIGWLGWRIHSLSPGTVGISHCSPDGPAQRVGLRPTDQVVSINGKPVIDELGIWFTIAERAGGMVALGVRRENKTFVRSVNVLAANPDGDSVRHGYAARLRDATLQALRSRNAAGRKALVALSEKYPSAAIYNNLGVSFESEDDMAGAILSYRRAVRLEPDAALYRANLARTLYKIGNLARAAEEYQAASVLESAWIETKRQWIKCLIVAGRTAEALDIAESHLSRFPRFAELLTIKGQVLIAMHEPERAIEALKQALSLDAWDSHTWFELGEANHDLRRFDEAETAFRKAIELDPADAGIVNNLGNVLKGVGKLKEAEQCFRRASTLYPLWSTPLNNLGALLFDLGRFQEAEDCFRRALEIEPSNMMALGNLGNVLRQVGRTKEAEELLRGAIARNPNHGNPPYMLGILLWQTGRPSEAEKYAREACRLDPGNANTHVMLGAILGALGKRQEEEQAFLAALEAEPDNFYAHDNLGALYSRMGRWREAEGHARKATQLNPGFPGPFNNLAWSLWMLGHSEEAIEAFRRAIAHPRKQALAYVGLGDVLLRSGRGAESVEILRKGAQDFPKDPLIHATLALSLARTSGDLDEALRLAKAATELDPLMMEARAILGTVHLHRQEMARAEEHLSAALRGTAFGRSRFSAIRWGDLGLAYERSGKLDQAKEAYRNSLQLDPKETAALEGLKRLGG